MIIPRYDEISIVGKELKRLVGIIDNSDNNSDVLLIKSYGNGLKTFVLYIINELGIDSAIKTAARGVEVIKKSKDNIEYCFILNHNGHTVNLSMNRQMRDMLTENIFGESFKLPGYGVCILSEL